MLISYIIYLLISSPSHFRNTYYLMSLVYQTSHFTIFSFSLFAFSSPSFWRILFFLFVYSLLGFNIFSEYIYYNFSVFKIFLALTLNSCFLWGFFSSCLSIFGLSWWRYSPNVWWSLVASSCWKLSWLEVLCAWEELVDQSTFLKSNNVTNQTF